MPCASAAPETSPTTCSRSGWGASASAALSSSLLPPTAVRSSKRGIRRQRIDTNICSHIYGNRVEQTPTDRESPATSPTPKGQLLGGRPPWSQTLGGE